MSEAHTDPHPDVAGYVLGGLEPDERAAFEAHLGGCPVCRADVDQLGSLPGLLDQAVPGDDPPADLKGRTLTAVAAATREAEAAPASGEAPAGSPQAAGEASAGPPQPPPPGEAPAPAPVAGLAGARRRRGARAGDGRRFRPTSRLAAAAAVVVALAATVTVVDMSRTTRPAAAEIELVAAPGETGRGHATVRRAGDGLVVELDVEGLPPSPPGTYYECWFVGEGDSLEAPNRVSAGTFTVGADGEAELRMASAADLDRFPKMGVTREPDDGNPQRTGPKVLVTP